MSGGSQTTTTKSDPWAPAQPALKLGLAEAEKNYKAGAGSFVPETNLAGQSQATTDALGLMEAQARAGNTPFEKAALGFAACQFKPGENPYLTDAIRLAQDEAATTLGGRMAASGRYGSGVHQNLVAKAVADTGLKYRMDDFNNQQQLRMGLLQQYPTLAAMNNAPAAALAGVGTARDARAQDVLTDANAIAQEKSNLPWDQLAKFQAGTIPYGGQGGTVVSTQKQSTNPFSMVGGGLLAGLGALGKAAPFFSLLSDERAKEDIGRVGKLDNGLTVHAYRYKGDPTPQIGLLAQEVAEKRPEAVTMGGDGLLRVAYDLAVKKKAA